MAGALVVALAVSPWQYQRATRASVPEVAGQAAIATLVEPAQALQMTVDGTRSSPVPSTSTTTTAMASSRRR
jgi:hypothetical protein